MYCTFVQYFLVACTKLRLRMAQCSNRRRNLLPDEYTFRASSKRGCSRSLFRTSSSDTDCISTFSLALSVPILLLLLLLLLLLRCRCCFYCRVESSSSLVAPVAVVVVAVVVFVDAVLVVVVAVIFQSLTRPSTMSLFQSINQSINF